ncbi:peptide/nickel transport system ATP-binding protein [Phyllobacterium sp. YR620]|uniref:ABC transporter ATP-binding protein n=1 Tax=Phyllobacterium sp. YR620 TaxID=1881066 RepID=UPI000889775F|nr:ABC transporter ATP-binding protein [Phyllobacterium sp. YR620]SDP71515.1 peptide/nickel transport system ATP-binding protein [Phyllobacterium sp. YR620]
MSKPYLHIAGLSVRYGAAVALEDISLEVSQGERLALIGESGSGKSTLAMAVAGLLPEAAKATGSVDFPTLGYRPRPGKDIGVLFQDPNGSLDPVMNVGDQIAEVAMIHQGIGWIAARVRAAELLGAVQISRPLTRLNSYPHEFSGGQKQRIALAIALAGNPSLLIADEPTSALDTVVQRHIVNLLDRLVRDNGLTLIFVTHDIALASERADKIGVLYKGRLVEFGPAADVLGAPRHPYTRALVDTHISLDTPRRKRLAEIDTAGLE